VSQYIVELQELIQQMHVVQSRHIDSLRVTAILENNTIGRGMIEVFELNRRPKAPIAYAWAQDMNKPGIPKKYFATSQFS